MTIQHTPQQQQAIACAQAILGVSRYDGLSASTIAGLLEDAQAVLAEEFFNDEIIQEAMSLVITKSWPVGHAIAHAQNKVILPGDYFDVLVDAIDALTERLEAGEYDPTKHYVGLNEDPKSRLWSYKMLADELHTLVTGAIEHNDRAIAALSALRGESTTTLNDLQNAAMAVEAESGFTAGWRDRVRTAMNSEAIALTFGDGTDGDTMASVLLRMATGWNVRINDTELTVTRVNSDGITGTTFVGDEDESSGPETTISWDDVESIHIH